MRWVASPQRAPRSSPESAGQVQAGPRRREVDLSSHRRLTFRFMYVIDISTVQLYCNTMSFRLFKVFAKSLQT